MKKQQYIQFSVFVILCLSIVSCAPSGHTSAEYGFFSGIWHGFCVFPFSLLGKLFGLDIGLYAEHNSGFLYWLGFIIGIGGLGGSARSQF